MKKKLSSPIRSFTRFRFNDPRILTWILLISGIFGVFLPFLNLCTKAALILSILFIPGAVLFRLSRMPGEQSHPIKILVTSILLSVTILTVFILFFELLKIPMISESGYEGGAGILFQLGILIYSGFFICIDMVKFPEIHKTSCIACPILNYNPLRVIRMALAVIIIFGVVLLLSWIILSSVRPPPTTELYFDNDNNISNLEKTIPVEIVVVNHEGTPALYNLLVNLSGKEQIVIPFQVEDGKSYRQTIPVMAKNKKNNITVSLDYSGSSNHPYRKIWSGYSG